MALALVAERPTAEVGGLHRVARLGLRTNWRNSAVIDMLRNLRDYTPDIAHAVENILTLANPGYELQVYKAKASGQGGDPVPDEEGLRLVQQFATRMLSEYSGAYDEIAGADSMYPGLDTFINMIHLAVATYGAAAAETELTPDLKDMVDIYPVDPRLIDFQRDKITGRWTAGLSSLGQFKPLDPIRFRYVPKDPEADEPAGRPPLLAALDTVFFQSAFLRELQAVIHMQGYPRIDIAVMRDIIEQTIEEHRADLTMPGNEADREAYVNGHLTDLQTLIEGLKPDQAFIHWDTAKVQYVSPGGAAIPIENVLDAIDNQLVSAVKQLPILLGRNAGSTTTHATVQWQVYVGQLGGYQKISRTLVQWALNLYLQIQGRQSYATLDYYDIKTSDALVDAQAENLEATTLDLAVRNGWIDDDEAAMALYGHAAVKKSTPAEPTPVDTPPPADTTGNQSQPSEATAAILAMRGQPNRHNFSLSKVGQRHG